MRGLVIDKQKQVEIGRGLLVDALEKTQESLGAVARHAFTTLPVFTSSAAKSIVVPLRL
jgi:hypothetical protein